MSRIATYTGRSFDVFDPSPADIHIEDIAHALAHCCRYNGHTTRFYSVAEHCVIASRHCNQRYALHVLLHDAAEAYLSDVPRPIKMMLPAYTSHEIGVHAAILSALGIPSQGPAALKEIERADLRMLATEKHQLLPNCVDDWPVLDGVDPYYFTEGVAVFVPIALPCWAPKYAKRNFLERFRELGGFA